MRKWIPALALCLLPFAAPVGESACGDAAAPCRAAGGEYLVLSPEGPPKGAVLILHGYSGTAEGQLKVKALTPLLARGYAIVAPQGEARGEGRPGGSWNSFADPGRRDDVAFLAAVADDAARRFGFARERTILAGFSGGGIMTWRAACDAPEAFSAYAPVAGLLWRPLPERCAAPVRMLHVHGWSDPVVPLEGRAVAGGRIVQGDLFAGLAMMRRTLGCGRDDPDEYAAAGELLVRSWSDCAPGAALAMALHPGGHMVPEGWADLTLDWFEGLNAATSR